MSRHQLLLSGGRRVIIGFDRPVGAFFCQEWHKDSDEPFATDDCVDLDAFDDHYIQAEKCKLPIKLRELLILEAAGQSDTNAHQCWDWCWATSW